MESDVAKTLQEMPFGMMIGAPLSACVEAQEQAAVSTVNFIRNVGFERDANGKISDKVINVEFQYKKGDNIVTLTVPLLTIVPIPYIAIDTVDINFKAAVTDTATTYARDSEYNASSKNAIDLYLGRKSVGTMLTKVSTKKDSVATSQSSLHVEATIDVNVKAHQDSLPAGLSKVLEILQNAIEAKDSTADGVVDMVTKAIATGDIDEAKVNAAVEAGKKLKKGK